MRTEIPLAMNNATVFCDGFRPQEGTTLKLVALYGDGKLTPAVRITAANDRKELVKFPDVELVTNSMNRCLANGCDNDPELAFDIEMLECIFGTDLEKAHEVIVRISENGQKCGLYLVPEGMSLRRADKAESLGYAEIPVRDIAWLFGNEDDGSSKRIASA